MRIALLTGADPKRSSGGPKVRLLKGDWIIRVEGREGTLLKLGVNDSVDPLHLEDGSKFYTHDVAVVNVIFHERGNEKYLTVIAEKVA